MSKGRLEAFSDGVIAIIITIMVLEFHAPAGASLQALRPLIPKLLSYILSFVIVGIYWNNHHHLLQATRHITGAVLWANLHLLFWLSLTPFTTAWMGENHFAAIPVAVYGCVLLGASIAYYILVRALLADSAKNYDLAAALGRDLKGKISVLIYLATIVIACKLPRVACALYVAVAIIWFVPDTRIERKITEHEPSK
jgi:uncharacterized membrane protein